MARVPPSRLTWPAVGSSVGVVTILATRSVRFVLPTEAVAVLECSRAPVGSPGAGARLAGLLAQIDAMLQLRMHLGS